MPEVTIQVIDDEIGIRDLLVSTLKDSGYAVEQSNDALQAKEKILNGFLPSLILLDWMMPGMNGLEMARWLKKDNRFAHIPIIMLTARDDDDYKVLGFEAGVEDYITKPFSTRELLARVKTVLRRSGVLRDEIIKHKSGLEMDVGQHRASLLGQLIHLGPTEFRLLYFFITHSERVFSRSQILDFVWGHNVYIEERTVDVHIRRLRKALDPFDLRFLIQTVRGVGYRFSEKTIENDKL